MSVSTRVAGFSEGFAWPGFAVGINSATVTCTDAPVTVCTVSDALVTA